MTRKDLARIVAKKTKLSRHDAENLIIAFGEIIGETLSKGDKIIYSNFGSFYTVHYPSKVIYHPRLGMAKKMIMLPTNATKWMPSDNIKKMVNSGVQVENATVHGKKKLTTKDTATNFKQSSKTSVGDIDDIGANNPALKKEEEIQIPIRMSRKPTPLENDDISQVTPIENKPVNSKAVETPSINSTNNTEKPVNIYEELMNDGSKVESTFADAIRVPRTRAGAFFNRFLGKKNDQVDEVKSTPTNPPDQKVSLVGAGIFDAPEIKDKANAPKPVEPPIPLNDQPVTTETNSLAPEKPLEQPTESINPEQAGPGPDFGEKINEIPISPFPTVKNPVSYIDLAKTIVPKEILQKIPERIARKYKVVPISEENGEMIVAMIDPEDIEAREIIKKYIQESISIRLTTEDDINHVLDQYSALESEIESAIETADSEEAEKDKGKDNDKAILVESASDNAPAAKIVTSLLRRAIREKASDIHIEPDENEVEVRFRLDGILKKTASLPKDIQSAVISRIKILSSLKIDEQRMPQDGRFSLTVDNRRVDFRISTMPVAYGEKIVMRVLDKVSGILTIEQLGIRGSGLEALKTNIEKSHGMTLVTGPTGSGKTTTLYALIERIYNESINIITLEDPIEYRMPGINQSQVNAEIDYTFASGLRSIVRQDPDVIMIGEIRDPETAEMAVHAALTGHIVLSTLHTNDSAGAAPRMMDMGVEPFLLTSSLNCVVGQRLTRKICEDCKEEVKPGESEIKQIQDILDKLPENEKKTLGDKPIKMWKGKGCKTCANSGYKGRLGVYEVLNITEEIKEMILQKQSSYKIQEKAIEQGMVTMIQDGILKVLDGITSLEEVWRVIKE